MGGSKSSQMMTKRRCCILPFFLLLVLFSCCVSASILQSNTNREAVGLRCFQGMITIFSVISVAMLSASMLPGYFKYISYFFCCIPVIVHTISDKRWFRDWFSKTSLVLAWYHQRWWVIFSFIYSQEYMRYLFLSFIF